MVYFLILCEKSRFYVTFLLFHHVSERVRAKIHKAEFIKI